MILTIEEILNATGGKLLNGDADDVVTSVSIDSRKVQKNDMFIAIDGENFDAHNFLESAYENGARTFLIDKKADFLKGNIIKVKSTIKAMGDIAAYYISTLNITKIAVTGSVGKTSTKDMIFSVLSGSYKTLKTEGNFNNHIGLPLTAYRLEDEECAVFEMGMSNKGEISYLSNIVKPDIAVITNIGYSHIENLGSREGILNAKLEVIEGMDIDKGLLILNGDEGLLYNLKDKLQIKTLYYGIDNPDCDIVGKVTADEEEYIEFSVNNKKYSIDSPGVYNVYNALGAILCAKSLNIDERSISQGISSYKPYSMRMNIVEHDGYTLLLDCYNSSPSSLTASLRVLSNMKSKKRQIAMLGSVAELGSMRDKLLYSIGKLVHELGITMLVTVSPDALALCEGAKDAGMSEGNIFNFDTNKEAAEFLKNNAAFDDVILIKASRAYKFEEIAEMIMA